MTPLSPEMERDLEALQRVREARQALRRFIQWSVAIGAWFLGTLAATAWEFTLPSGSAASIWVGWLLCVPLWLVLVGGGFVYAMWAAIRATIREAEKKTS